MNPGMTVAESHAWFFKWRECAKSGRSHRERELRAIESELELESDEFYTARQKAERVLATRTPIRG